MNELQGHIGELLLQHRWTGVFECSCQSRLPIAQRHDLDEEEWAKHVANLVWNLVMHQDSTSPEMEHGI